MTEQAPRFEVTERHERSGEPGDHVFSYQPDYYNPMYPAFAEFVFRASAVLTEFRETWLAEHPNDAFAMGFEMDNIPVLTEGMVTGFLGLSESDGATYDYFPALSLNKKETK